MNPSKEESYNESGYQFVRIAHLDIKDKISGAINLNQTVQMGVFGCCPEAQEGGAITFKDFTIEKGTTFAHTN